MNRNHSKLDRAARIAAILTLSVVAPSCSSDDENGTPGGADAGSGGSNTGTGGKSAGGGTGGHATGGASGSGGKAQSGGGSGGVAGKDGGSGDGDAADGASSLTPLSGTLFAAGATYTDGAGEIVALELATGRILGKTAIGDGDIAVSSSGGQIFAVEREGGAVDVLSPFAAIQKHIPIDTGDGGTLANPHDPLVVSATKAYVPLNAANAIAIIDPTAGTKTGLISLAAFLDPSDHDGSTEPDGLYYDASKHRAYFVLPRTDIFSGTAASNYMPACPPVPSLVIAVDTSTDQIVDLNGDAGGQGYALPLVAPAYWAPGKAAGTFYLMYDGCNASTDGGALRDHHGIASIDLGTGVSKTLYTPTAQGFLGGLMPIGTSFLVLEDSSLRPWSTAAPTTLGTALTGVPNGAIVASDTTLVGYENASVGDGSLRPVVFRYELGSEKKTRLVPIPFSKGWGFTSLTLVK